MDKLHGIDVMHCQINPHGTKPIIPRGQHDTDLRVKPAGIIQKFQTMII